MKSFISKEKIIFFFRNVLHPDELVQKKHNSLAQAEELNVFFCTVNALRITFLSRLHTHYLA